MLLLLFETIAHTFIPIFTALRVVVNIIIIQKKLNVLDTKFKHNFAHKKIVFY